MSQACIKPGNAQQLKSRLQDQHPGGGIQECLETSCQQFSTPVSPKSAATARISSATATNAKNNSDSEVLPFFELVPLLEEEVRKIEMGAHTDAKKPVATNDFVNQSWPDADAFLLKMFPLLRGATLCA